MWRVCTCTCRCYMYMTLFTYAAVFLGPYNCAFLSCCAYMYLHAPVLCALVLPHKHVSFYCVCTLFTVTDKQHNYIVSNCSTLEERAQRLFSTKGVPLENLDPTFFAKSKNPRGKDPEKQKDIAFLESQIYRYSELLGVSYHDHDTAPIMHEPLQLFKPATSVS